jgi:hypothetical protein
MRIAAILGANIQYPTRNIQCPRKELRCCMWAATVRDDSEGHTSSIVDYDYEQDYDYEIVGE